MKWRDDLAKPITVSGNNRELWYAPLRLERREPDDPNVRAKRERKLGLLFQHYRIRQNLPDAWERLARALANDCVPGFRVDLKTGSPIQWSLQDACDLYRFWIAARARGPLQGTNRPPSDKVVWKNRLMDDKAFRTRFETLKEKSAYNRIAEARALRRERIAWAIIRAGRLRDPGTKEALNDSSVIPAWVNRPPPWAY